MFPKPSAGPIYSLGIIACNPFIFFQHFKDLLLVNAMRNIIRKCCWDLWKERVLPTHLNVLLGKSLRQLLYLQSVISSSKTCPRTETFRCFLPFYACNKFHPVPHAFVPPQKAHFDALHSGCFLRGRNTIWRPDAAVSE